MHYLIALATNSDVQPRTSLDVVIQLIPWLVSFVLIYLLIKPAVIHLRRASEINEHIMRDCDVLEAKLDKIIEILERGPV